MKSLNAFGTKHPALAETGPDQPAHAQRQQSLDGMEAGAEGVGPRVEPGPDALHLVAAQADHDRRQRTRGDHAEVRQVGPGDEEHREDGQGDDDRSCRGRAP